MIQQDARSEITALGFQISESFLAHQLHFVVQMSEWKGGLEPESNIFNFQFVPWKDKGGPKKKC